ncbi:MAG: lipopolysaccharide heptosyltransferase I [Sulfurimonas sp.]|nr:lipopolysaccharide heptosyltransferase I [Sulfurimonas sp.]
MKKDIKSIAIVRLSALGDIINSAVILQFIHKKYPDAKIEWITEEVFAPLLQNHPLLHRVHTINLKELKKSRSLKEFFKTISKLRSLGKFDIIIDMQGLLKSSIVARLIGKKTHGFDKNSSRESISRFFYKTTSYIEYDENIVKRNIFLASDGLGFRIDDSMLLNKQRVFDVEKYPLSKSEKKNIAIVIGASWESKKYPKEKVAQLCDELGENCYIVWGDEKEREDALWICKNSASAILAPKLSLLDLVSFISSVDLLIGNDTGPTHIAWAQNIASITLFGPTTKRMIYETSKNLFLKSDSKVDIYHIDKNDFSIKDIEVKNITKKARELLI